MRSDLAISVPRVTFPRRVASLMMIITLSATLSSFADLQVTGVGKVEAKPNTVEMAGQISAEAELVGDAITKFEANKRRVIDALKGLNLEQLEIRELGISFTAGAGGAQAQQMAMMRGQAMPTVAAKVSVIERLTITLKGVDTTDEKELLSTIVKVIDAGKDAGLNMSPPPMNVLQAQMTAGQPASLAVFKLVNTTSLQQEALDAAMKDAFTNAGKLAKIAGVELGAVTDVSEGPVADDKNPQAAYLRMFMPAMGGKDESIFTSPTLSDIPISASVNVTFDIK